MAAEKQFENKIKSELKRRGCWFVKFFANAFTPAGIPDILACVCGRFVAIEVKGGSGYGLTDLQRYNLEKINSVGGIGLCVYPSGWGQLMQILDRIEAGERVTVADDTDSYILK